jgi:hypothetical protein
LQRANRIYDFAKASAEVSIAGIRANMEAEAGTTDEAMPTFVDFAHG